MAHHCFVALKLLRTVLCKTANTSCSIASEEINKQTRKQANRWLHRCLPNVGNMCLSAACSAEAELAVRPAVQAKGSTAQEVKRTPRLR